MEAKQMLKQAGYDELPESPFKIGDIVQLKSGGPAMTVIAVHPYHITVAYFVDGARLTDSMLPPEALMPLNPPPSYADMATAP